jgi:NAD(P)-dependent dehydrogenase (short-subunit alcohol dehydrogenase family)
MSWSTADISDQKGKTFVVTGGNTGIGFATVSALAAKRGRVILACRNLDKGNAALAAIKARQSDADVSVGQLDLASLASVRAFSERLTNELPQIDALINNAGVMMVPQGRTVDGFETQFGTNVLGHFALTGLLLPLLNKASQGRVVTLSSLAHWFGTIDFDNLGAEKGYQKLAAYAQSKLGNLVFAYELQRRLSKLGASTISIGAHPGVTQSELGRNSWYESVALSIFGQRTEDGALPSLMAAVDTQVHGGDYVGPGGLFAIKGAPTRQKSSEQSHAAALGAKLWEVSQVLSGVRYL